VEGVGWARLRDQGLHGGGGLLAMMASKSQEIGGSGLLAACACLMRWTDVLKGEMGTLAGETKVVLLPRIYLERECIKQRPTIMLQTGAVSLSSFRSIEDHTQSHRNFSSEGLITSLTAWKVGDVAAHPLIEPPCLGMGNNVVLLLP
jgi:hypothetical protein